ncbi:pimeloyl-ACP methyl ester carboxylesterase [Paenibacillus sp. JGP012]|uniref:alpha/beta hydrolase n=1 Tax=Paenibacillus sp. JGP012 TaxID=2735914 RepID=UPI001848C32C|nr:alpha/beta hydrolase [Paenibacillus sp. JGP012]MBB6020177.1 pimeloyl-ACP methyl ester carboxylesterase [Paenibacillus sp. JGP012]
MTHTKGKHQQPYSRLRRILRILLKVIMIIILAIVLFVGIVYTVNRVSSHSEMQKLEPYGQLVSVAGKQMNVLVEGEGEETIVILPGFGMASPALDFKPLLSRLKSDYRVIVIEPFGYGLSDQTEKERSTANISSEIHEALQRLGTDRYILMAHSISGLYSLDYVNRYPDEVEAFIGLDHSVPSLSEQKVETSDIVPVKWFRNLGFARLQLKLGDDPYEGLPYDEKTQEQLNILIRKNMYNDTQLNEAVSMYSNFQAAKALTFPADLPVLFFVQKNHPVVHEWVSEHEKQIVNSEQGEIVLLEADHYLYRSHSTEIADKIKDFTESRM